MKNNNHFSIKSNGNNPFWTTIICFLFIFIPYIVIFIISKLNIENSLLTIKDNKISLILYIVIFSMIVILIPLIIIFKFFFKKIDVESIPFLFSTSIGSIMLFIAELIPDIKNFTWIIIICRLLIVLISSIFSFLTINWILNIFLINSSKGFYLYKKFKFKQINEDYEIKQYEECKKNKRPEYIEIEKDK